MNVFVCPKHDVVMVAFNRGHACKILAKVLEERGEKLDKKDTVEKVDVDKCQVILMEGTNEVLPMWK